MTWRVTPGQHRSPRQAVTDGCLARNALLAVLALTMAAVVAVLAGHADAGDPPPATTTTTRTTVDPVVENSADIPASIPRAGAVSAGFPATGAPLCPPGRPVADPI